MSAYSVAVLADNPTGYWRMDEAGLPQDSSPSANHMTADTRTIPQVAGLLVSDPASKARGFTPVGGGSFLQPPGTYLLNTFTAEAWVKLNAAGGGYYVMVQYNGGLGAIISADGTLGLNKSFTGTIAQTTTLKITDTAVHHYVITRAGIGGAVVFYLDGVSETPTQANPSFDCSGASGGFFVGSEWGNSAFDGTLDEVAIYPTVLSPARVLAHYNAGIGAAAGGGALLVPDQTPQIAALHILPL